MKFDIEPGTYVVAVSGGVDSVSLLHMLQKQPDLRLVVAHLDHGMRPDSHLDRRLVEAAAGRSALPFVYHRVELGELASEERARNARYTFLHHVRQTSGARAIITAHHQDDLLETAILNLLRGTGRRGISAMMASETVIRPFLHMRKRELIDYAVANGLQWREDSTNTSGRYLRNHIRHNVLPKITEEERSRLIGIIHHVHGLNRAIDTELMHALHMQPAVGHIDRHWFVMLPHSVAREVIAACLRQRGILNYDKRTLERLVIAGKTYFPGQITDINKGWLLTVHKNRLALEPRDR